jgi:hypothetical protein
MPTAPDADRKPSFPGEVDRVDHVGRPARPHDDGRVVVKHAVDDGPPFVMRVLGWPGDLAFEADGKLEWVRTHLSLPRARVAHEPGSEFFS